MFTSETVGHERLFVCFSVRIDGSTLVGRSSYVHLHTYNCIWIR